MLLPDMDICGKPGNVDDIYRKDAHVIWMYM